MSPIFIGIMGITLLFVLLLLGMPIAFVLMFTGFVGIYFLASPGAALPMAARTLYEVASNYPYAVIPLFLLMGSFAGTGGLVSDLYSFFDKWFRRLPGGLGIATIAACAGFAAVSGSSVATAAAIGSVSYPEMKKFNYNPRLSTGTIIAGGTLGFLIPPSIGFAVFGMLTEQSVGRLLIAGIVPGLILSGTFIATIIFMVKIKPSLAPPTPGIVTWGEKILSLKKIWETLLVFLVVMGGIYLGWFTPTEAGAVGAFLLFIICLVKQQLSLNALLEAMRESVRVSAMVLFLVAGASVFSYFLALSTIPAVLATWVAGLEISKYIIFAFIILIYIILGCFVDSVSMMVLTLPVVFPVIVALGFDPIFFGVVCVLMMEAGLITPPLGMNLYTVAGVAKDATMEDIIVGAIPFILPIFVVVIILTMLPGIALFLPNAMLGKF